MNRDRMFELRVLTGTHAGARALLSDQPQLVGSSDDCDLILRDEGMLAQHARLEHQDDGTTVLRWIGSELEPLVIRPGQDAALGPVRIAVDSVDAPWVRPPETQTSRADADADAAATEPLALAREAQPPRLASVVQPGWVRRTQRLRIALLLAVLLIVAAASAWLRVRTNELPADSPQDRSSATAAQSPAAGNELARQSVKPATAPPGTISPSGATPMAVAPAVPAALQQAIDRLHLRQRVHVEQLAGRSVVHGWLLTDEESESLAAALVRVSPRPRLKLWSQEDVAGVIEQAAGADPSRPMTARHAGDGRFVVTGRVGDDTVRGRIQHAWGRAFPRTPLQLDLRVRTDEEASAALLGELRTEGFGTVDARWSDGRLLMQVRLARAQVPAWERALVATARSHDDVPFQVQVELFDPPTATAAARVPEPAPAPPFAIRSVVSSELPFVVLADGSKLVAGATVQGWRLLEVQPREIVFEAPGGRRITLER